MELIKKQLISHEGYVDRTNQTSLEACSNQSNGVNCEITVPGMEILNIDFALKIWGLEEPQLQKRI